MPNISNTGNVIATGTIIGTGAAIPVVCGFTPSEIQIINITHEVVLQYNEEMPADHGYKTLGTGAGTISSTTAVNNPSAVTVSSLSGTAAAQTITVGTHESLQTITGEVVAVNAGTGVSAAVVGNPTAIFNSVSVTASGGGPFQAEIVATGIGVATGQVSINYTTGVMTFLIADAVTSATVDYVRRVTAGFAATNGTSAVTGTGSGTAAAEIQNPHTHTFTGSSSDNAYITTGGITLNANGFTIGTDTDLNQIGDSLIIAAWRK